MSKRDCGRGPLISLVLICLLMAACTPPADRAQGFYESGMTLLAAGDAAKASLQFQNALQADPAFHQASYGLALAAESRQAWPEMLRQLDNTLQQAPAFWRAHVKRGQLLLAANYPVEAAESAERALMLAPSNPQALTLRAAVALRQGDGASAARFATAALAGDSEGVEPLVILARERALASDHAGALDYARQALAREPDNVGLGLLQAALIEASGDAGLAERRYRALAESHPAHPAPRRALVRFLLERDAAPAAEALLRARVDSAPDTDAVLELAELLATTAGAEAALAALAQYAPGLPGDPRLTWRRAELEMARNDLSAAALHLRTIAAEPERPGEAAQARGLLAMINLDVGELRQAEAEIDEALALDAGAPGVRLAAAGTALAGQRPELAATHLRAALADDPGEPNAHRLLGAAYEMLGSPTLAEQHYRQAVDLDSDAKPAVAYARYLLEGGRRDAARRILERSGDEGAIDDTVAALLARIVITDGNVPAARGLAHRLAAAGDEEAARLVDFLAGELPAAAGQSAGHSGELDTDSAELPLPLRLEWLMRQQRHGEAHAAVEAALAAGPTDASPLLLKAWLLHHRGEADQAATLIEQAVADYPRDPAAYLALSQMQLRVGNTNAAAAVLDRGRAALPDANELLLARAQLFELNGELEQAVAAYEQLLEAAPESDIVVNNLAALLLETRGDTESLQRAWQLARRFQHSSVAEFLDTAGWANYRTGRVVEAVALLERAAEQANHMAAVHYHLGVAYAALQRTDDARGALANAVVAEDHTGAYRRRAQEALQNLGAGTPPAG